MLESESLLSRKFFGVLGKKIAVLKLVIDSLERTEYVVRLVAAEVFVLAASLVFENRIALTT
jgi:hypothetical protein